MCMLLFTVHFIVMASLSTGSTPGPITPGTGDVEGMHILLSTIIDPGVMNSNGNTNISCCEAFYAGP